MSVNLSMLLVVAVLCVAAVAHAQDPSLDFRLPTTVTPTHYVLRLDPDMEQNTVSGTVKITLITTRNTTTTDPMTSISLHLGSDSQIVEYKASLLDFKGVAVPNISVDYDSQRYAQIVKILLPEDYTLEFNQMYLLSLEFKSPIYSSPNGLFSGYFNSTSKYVGSAMRATFARNVFPCFDEPWIRAPISLQVSRPVGYTTYSTANRTSYINVSDSVVLDIFETTPAIPASALGLFISQLEPQPSQDGSVNFFLASGNSSSSQLISDLISNITKLLGEFPTVLPLNLIVLNDKPAGSFSTFGFVFTTPEVVYNTVSAVVRAQQLHVELAEALLHQWLAYASTPGWWSDLWLTDSVAAYLATQLTPTLGVDGLEATSVRSNGLDSYTGPVVDKNLLAPLDIETAIAQQTIRNKGLSILTMWRDTLPEGVLNATILEYISLRLKTPSTQDFLDLLDENIQAASSQYNATTVISELSSWLLADGSPHVSVSSVDDTNILLSQSVGCTSAVSTLWPVSVSFTQRSAQNWTNVREGLWLTGNNLSVSVSKDEWTIFNLENAPYRTNYNDSWSAIASAISGANASSIPVAVRASIQADVIALALNGCLPFSTALNILNSTVHAQADWLVVSKALSSLNNLISNEEYGLEQLQLYAKTLFSADLLSQVSLSSSGINTDQWFARSVLTPWLCKFDLGNCRGSVNSLAVAAFSGNSSVDPNDIDNVVCLSSRYNPVVSTLLEGYTDATSLEQRRLFVIALGCLNDETSVQTLLSNITAGLLTPRDARDVLVNLASSVENINFLEDFIVNNAVDLQKPILGSGFLADVIKALGQYRISLTKLSVLTNNTVGLSWYVKQSIVQTTQQVNTNMAWWETNGQNLELALPYVTPAPNTTTISPNSTAIPPNSTTTSKPSSAEAFSDLRVISLLFSVAVALLLRSL